MVDVDEGFDLNVWFLNEINIAGEFVNGQTSVWLV